MIKILVDFMLRYLKKIITFNGNTQIYKKNKFYNKDYRMSKRNFYNIIYPNLTNLSLYNVEMKNIKIVIPAMTTMKIMIIVTKNSNHQNK
jgi:hypothetical protein